VRSVFVIRVPFVPDPMRPLERCGADFSALAAGVVPATAFSR